MKNATRLGPYTALAQKMVLDALVTPDDNPGPTWKELAGAFVVLLLGALDRPSPDEDQDPEPETKPADGTATHAEVAEGLALRTRADYEAQDDAWRDHLRQQDPRRVLRLSHAGENLGSAWPLPGGRWQLDYAGPRTSGWAMSFTSLASLLNYLADENGYPDRSAVLVETDPDCLHYHNADKDHR